MRKIPCIVYLILLLFAMDLNGQFYGGDEDGYGSDGNFPGTMSPQEVYCSGGDADGFHSQTAGLMTLNSQDEYCSGGNADGGGSQYSGMTTVNDQWPYCRGGNSDGASATEVDGYFFDPLMVFDGGNSDGTASGMFDGLLFELNFTLGGSYDGTSSKASGMTSLNQQYFYCQAGQGDGHGSHLYTGSFMPWLYCQGGGGDGFKSGASSMEELGLGIWTGYTSDEWTEAGNWMLNTVPGSSTSVLLPGGAFHYPRLTSSLSIAYYSGVHKCKRLDIYPQASLAVWSDLIVNGTLNVAGTLELHRQTDNSLHVKVNGELTVKAGGAVILTGF